MKQTILAVLISMTVSTFAWAQAPAARRKMTVQTAPSTYGSYATNEVTALLGFTGGAPNFGADYARMSGAWGFGGFFFLQSSKDKAPAVTPSVSQVMSFGGLLKVNFVDIANVKAFIAPGIGFMMVKDGSYNAASNTKADETVIGPVWKMGVLYKLNSALNIGLETTSFGNFFNDNLTNYAAPSRYYSIAATFSF